MTKSSVRAAIESARREAGLSQRDLEERTGISQTTLSRILSGRREVKMTEIIKIAEATGCVVAQLTGTGVAERVQFAARAPDSSSVEPMRQRLVHFIELDAYLDSQAISVPR